MLLTNGAATILRACVPHLDGDYGVSGVFTGVYALRVARIASNTSSGWSSAAQSALLHSSVEHFKSLIAEIKL